MALLCPGGRVYLFPSRYNKGNLVAQLIGAEQPGYLKVKTWYGTLVSEKPPLGRFARRHAATIIHEGGRIIVVPPGASRGEAVDLAELEEVVRENVSSKYSEGAVNRARAWLDVQGKKLDVVLEAPVGFDSLEAPVVAASPAGAAAVVAGRYSGGWGHAHVLLTDTAMRRALASIKLSTRMGYITDVYARTPFTVKPHGFTVRIPLRGTGSPAGAGEAREALRRAVEALQGRGDRIAHATSSESWIAVTKVGDMLPLLYEASWGPCSIEGSVTLEAPLSGEYTLNIGSECRLLARMRLAHGARPVKRLQLTAYNTVVEANTAPQNYAPATHTASSEAERAGPRNTGRVRIQLA